MRKPTETQQKILKEQVGKIFAQDKKKLDEVLGGQGWRYLLGAILIFPLTLIKVFDFIFSSPHLWRDYVSENEDRKQQRLRSSIGLCEYNFNNKRAQYNEYRDNLTEYNKEAVRQKNIEYKKSEVLKRLQQRFDREPKLEGISIKVNYTNSGSIESQRITFGNEINSMFKVLFPSLKLLSMKGSKNTYLLLEKESLFDFEQKLRGIFLVPVTIILKRKSNKP